jgi:hypothetical protein
MKEYFFKLAGKDQGIISHSLQPRVRNYKPSSSVADQVINLLLNAVTVSAGLQFFINKVSVNINSSSIRHQQGIIEHSRSVSTKIP